MIYNLIPTQNYLLAVDDINPSLFVKGDWLYSPAPNDSIVQATRIMASKDFLDSIIKNTLVKKIIAHLPLNDAAILQDIPLLSTIPTTADDILSIHEDENEFHLHSVDRKWVIEAMEQYKGNAQYTLEDMEYAFECGRNFQNNAEVTFKESLQHLHQQKMPKAFECEVGHKYNPDNNDWEKYPLSVANQEGMQVWLGNYIF